jgi:hypothetical protein
LLPGLPHVFPPHPILDRFSGGEAQLSDVKAGEVRHNIA